MSWVLALILVFSFTAFGQNSNNVLLVDEPGKAVLRIFVNCEYKLVLKKDSTTSKMIIDRHFDMLKLKGKNIGSTPEDHYNCIDENVLRLHSTLSYIGYLGDAPVSTCIGEHIDETTIIFYTSISLRDPKIVLTSLGIEPGSEKSVGFSALSVYSYLCLFDKLLRAGYKKTHLGGSELPDLNIAKRHLGAKPDPTYWAVKLRK